MVKDELDKVEEELLKGEIEIALDLFIKFTKKNRDKSYKDILILKSQFSRLNKERSLGLKYDEEKENRVISTLTFLLFKVRKSRNLNPSSKEEVGRRLNYDRIIWVSLIILFVVYFIIYSLNERNTFHKLRTDLKIQNTEVSKIRFLADRFNTYIDDIDVTVSRNEISKFELITENINFNENDTVYVKEMVSSTKQICVQYFRLFRFLSGANYEKEWKEEIFVVLEDSLKLINIFPEILFVGDTSLRYVKKERFINPSFDFFSEKVWGKVTLSQIEEIVENSDYKLVFSILLNDNQIQAVSSKYKESIHLIFDLRIQKNSRRNVLVLRRIIRITNEN